MPLEPYLNASDHIRQLLFSRRGMLQAGLLPLLALRGSAGDSIGDEDPRHAMALPVEGGATGMHALAISPDGSTAYISFGNRDVVWTVDLLAGRMRSAIDLTPAGVILASGQTLLSADGKLLFVANQGVGNIAVIDTAAERVIKVLPFCPALGDSIKVSAADKVYIGLLDGRLITVSCADLSYTTTNFGVGFDSIALSPVRANLLYAVSLRDYHLGPQNGRTFFHAFNLDTGGEERRAMLAEGPRRPGSGVSRLEVAPSGEVAYLGWVAPGNSVLFGNITPFDLRDFQAGVSTAIEGGVTDFAVHPKSGSIHAVGGVWEGRPGDTLFITEWDPGAQKVSRRIPVSPAYDTGSILFDPANPRYVYSNDTFKGLMRKVDTLSGIEVMRVRFASGRRMLYAAAAAGSLGYITGYQTPLIHKLDLNSGKPAGTLDLPRELNGSARCEYHDGKLYLGDASMIYVVSAADGSLLFSRQVPDGLGLHLLTFFRDKIAAVAGPLGGDLDRVLILDQRTLNVLSSFPLELPARDRLGRVIASPDGTKLYVQLSIFMQRTVIQVLDSATLRVLKRIDLSGAAQGGSGDVGCFDEQNRIAYLGGFSCVYMVHMDTNELLGMLNNYDVYKEMGRTGGFDPTALSGIELSPAKDRLLITSWDGGCVLQYDLRNRKWIPRVVFVGLEPADPLVSPDRRSLYTLGYRSDAITRLDTTTGEVVDTIRLGGPVSSLGIDSLRHAASYQHVGAVPGCVMVVREGGGGLPGVIGPPFLTLLQLDGAGKVATELAGTKVLFDGVAAPLLHAYAAQVAVVVPYSVAGKRTVKMQLIYDGEENHPVEFNVGDAAPGIFIMDSTGQGQAVMLNEDYSLNGPASPAAKGSWVMFYASGGGQTDPPGVDGEVIGTVLPRPRLPVRVFIQGREVEVLYAGAAPGMVSGVLQVNVRIPMDMPSGNNLPLTMMVGPFGPSPDAVTMAVS